MAFHRVRVALRFVVLLVRQRGLRHEGTEAGLVGRPGEVGELILGHGEVFAQLAQACGDLREASLDEGSGHLAQSTLPPVRPPVAFSIAVLLSVALAAGACGGGSDAACGPIRREALDSAYLVHVLDEDAPGLEYSSEPPTSGPHKPGPELPATVDEPISRPVQVGFLEQGGVLLQHRPDLDPDERAALEALGGDRVTVAPNPDLDDAIVATAWLYKRRCDSFDRDALDEFIEQRRGKGPEGE